MLKMDLEYKKGILFVKLEGILNNKTSNKIYNYLIPVLKKHQIKYVVYNLAKLKDISESGIDAILMCKCIMKKYKGIIYLCKVNKKVAYKCIRLHLKTIAKEGDIINKVKV